MLCSLCSFSANVLVFVTVLLYMLCFSDVPQLCLLLASVFSQVSRLNVGSVKSIHFPARRLCATVFAHTQYQLHMIGRL